MMDHSISDELYSEALKLSNGKLGPISEAYPKQSGSHVDRSLLSNEEVDDDVGSIWDELEEQSSQPDLDREWQNRRGHFHTIGYRDGLTAGQEASAQEGFNEGFKESVLVGYRWGLVRGVTSALSCLSEGLREKMVESQEDRNNFQSLHESVHSLSTTEALESFHKNLMAKNPAEHSKRTKGSADVAYPKDESTNILPNYLKELSSLILMTPTIDVKFMVDELV